MQSIRRENSTRPIKSRVVIKTRDTLLTCSDTTRQIKIFCNTDQRIVRSPSLFILGKSSDQENCSVLKTIQNITFARMIVELENSSVWKNLTVVIIDKVLVIIFETHNFCIWKMWDSFIWQDISTMI